MQWNACLPLEGRLQRRYRTLVLSHLHCASELAAGVAALPTEKQSFAATQAAWRFLNNDRVSLTALVEPLRALGQDRAAATAAPFALLVHDWSKWTFANGRGGKHDRVRLTHAQDIGMELTTSLLVSADDGSPLAPLEMHCRTAQGLLSTRATKRPLPPAGHLEQVLPTMNASRTWGLSKPLLHVIDREADSVDHYRRWHQAGHRFLVRADDRKVRWREQPYRLSEIRAALGRGRHLQQVGEAGSALYRGQPASLFVAETEVVLDRPAKKKCAGVSVLQPGAPLPLRLVVVQLRDETGKHLAEWLLLSNAPRDWATTEHLARCYYWRWRIESFFKLLKSHGQQMEHWQQETGPALARRLLVAAMACVLVWQLQANDTPEAQAFKDVLIRLSGRQTKRHKRHTAPALLAGLWVLVSMLALLEHTDLEDLQQLAAEMSFDPSG